MGGDSEEVEALRAQLAQVQAERDDLARQLEEQKAETASLQSKLDVFMSITGAGGGGGGGGRSGISGTTSVRLRRKNRSSWAPSNSDFFFREEPSKEADLIEALKSDVRARERELEEQQKETDMWRDSAQRLVKELATVGPDEDLEDDLTDSDDEEEGEGEGVESAGSKSGGGSAAYDPYSEPFNPEVEQRLTDYGMADPVIPASAPPATSALSGAMRTRKNSTKLVNVVREDPIKPAGGSDDEGISPRGKRRAYSASGSDSGGRVRSRSRKSREGSAASASSKPRASSVAVMNLPEKKKVETARRKQSTFGADSGAAAKAASEYAEKGDVAVDPVKDRLKIERRPSQGAQSVDVLTKSPKTKREAELVANTRKGKKRNASFEFGADPSRPRGNSELVLPLSKSADSDNSPAYTRSRDGSGAVSGGGSGSGGGVTRSDKRRSFGRKGSRSLFSRLKPSTIRTKLEASGAKHEAFIERRRGILQSVDMEERELFASVSEEVAELAAIARPKLIRSARSLALMKLQLSHLKRLKEEYWIAICTARLERIDEHLARLDKYEAANIDPRLAFDDEGVDELLYTDPHKFCRSILATIKLKRKIKELAQDVAVAGRMFEMERSHAKPFSRSRQTETMQLVMSETNHIDRQCHHELLESRQSAFEKATVDSRIAAGQTLGEFFRTIRSSERVSPRDVVDFVDGLTHELINIHSLDPEDFSKCRLFLERTVFPRLYSSLVARNGNNNNTNNNNGMSSSGMSDTNVRDREFQAKCRWLRRFPPSAFGVDGAAAADDEVAAAIDEMCMLCTSVVPTDAQHQVFKALQHVTEAAGGGGAGADEIFPLLVYVCVQADLPSPWSVVEFINNYGSDQAAITELGYCVTMLEAALHHVSDLTLETFPPPDSVTPESDAIKAAILAGDLDSKTTPNANTTNNTNNTNNTTPTPASDGDSVNEAGSVTVAETVESASVGSGSVPGGKPPLAPTSARKNRFEMERVDSVPAHVIVGMLKEGGAGGAGDVASAAGDGVDSEFETVVSGGASDSLTTPKGGSSGVGVGAGGSVAVSDVSDDGVSRSQGRINNNNNSKRPNNNNNNASSGVDSGSGYLPTSATARRHYAESHGSGTRSDHGAVSDTGASSAQPPGSAGGAVSGSGNQGKGGMGASQSTTTHSSDGGGGGGGGGGVRGSVNGVTGETDAVAASSDSPATGHGIVTQGVGGGDGGSGSVDAADIGGTAVVSDGASTIEPASPHSSVEYEEVGEDEQQLARIATASTIATRTTTAGSTAVVAASQEAGAGKSEGGGDAAALTVPENKTLALNPPTRSGSNVSQTTIASSTALGPTSDGSLPPDLMRSAMNRRSAHIRAQRRKNRQSERERARSTSALVIGSASPNAPPRTSLNGSASSAFSSNSNAAGRNTRNNTNNTNNTNNSKSIPTVTIEGVRKARNNTTTSEHGSALPGGKEESAGAAVVAYSEQVGEAFLPKLASIIQWAQEQSLGGATIPATAVTKKRSASKSSVGTPPRHLAAPATDSDPGGSRRASEAEATYALTLSVQRAGRPASQSVSSH